jgi:ribosome-associated translation inhibitor RaiA
MIEKIKIEGINKFAVDEWTRKYAEKRLKRLDKFVPKAAKKEVAAKLTVAQVSRPYGNKYEMVATITVAGGPDYVAKDQVANMIAGVDILEAKLIAQMRKAKTITERKRKGLTHKIGRMFRRG